MEPGTKVKVINSNDKLYYRKEGKVIRNLSYIPSNQQYVAVKFKDNSVAFFVEKELKVVS